MVLVPYPGTMAKFLAPHHHGQEMTAITERRKKSRAAGRIRNLSIVLPERPDIHPGANFKAQVLDANLTGLGVHTPQPLAPGSNVTLEGHAIDPAGDRSFSSPARITWCSPVRDGGFRAGICLKNPAAVWGDPNAARTETPVDPRAANTEPDHYDSLQLSPKADPDTIHRVYRALAQRFHPDNRETGNEQAFRTVHQAYTILSHPELRAAYDVRRTAAYAYRVKIFARPADTEGLEGELRKRRGLLMVVYTQRMNDPEHPGVMLSHLEELLSVPREHLEFPLWFLREHGLISRTDNGRFSITAKGAAEYEAQAQAAAAPLASPQLRALLASS